jgi:hypothetical protein
MEMEFFSVFCFLSRESCAIIIIEDIECRRRLTPFFKENFTFSFCFGSHKRQTKNKQKNFFPTHRKEKKKRSQTKSQLIYWKPIWNSRFCLGKSSTAENGRNSFFFRGRLELKNPSDNSRIFQCRIQFRMSFHGTKVLRNFRGENMKLEEVFMSVGIRGKLS